MGRALLFLFLCLAFPTWASDDCVPLVEALAPLFEGLSEEHAMVRVALNRVAEASALDGPRKAALWRRLAAIIEQRTGHAVSRSYVGDWEGAPVHVFQGTRRFGGKVYLLVLLPDGTALTGLADPIDDMADWSVHLTTLAPLQKVPATF